MLLFVSNSNPSAAGETVIALPGAHSCVVQNKNSRTAFVQFNVSFISLENLLNLNPSDSNQFPYPNKKSATSCTVVKTYPYGIVCTVSL